MREILDSLKDYLIVVVAVGSGVAAGFLIGAAVHGHRFVESALLRQARDGGPVQCIKLEYTEARARAALLPAPNPAPTSEQEPW